MSKMTLFFEIKVTQRLLMSMATPSQIKVQSTRWPLHTSLLCMSTIIAQKAATHSIQSFRLSKVALLIASWHLVSIRCLQAPKRSMGPKLNTLLRMLRRITVTQPISPTHSSGPSTHWMRSLTRPRSTIHWQSLSGNNKGKDGQSNSLVVVGTWRLWQHQ